MSPLAPYLNHPSELEQALEKASLQQLQLARNKLEELIRERRHQADQQLLERKGRRVLSDMRTLMAKAGVSMDELQSVLPESR